MNPILQIIFKKRLLRLWIGLSLLGGLYAPLRAQTCPVGWTSAPNGTVYPVDASGVVFSGSLNNILFGGADGNVVRVNDKIWLDFGQTLAAGGTLSFVASSYSSSGTGKFNVTFSTDGTNFSTPILVDVPATTTLATYTVTAPQGFRYIQLVNPLNGAGNYTLHDAISYQGAVCQPSIVSYASCGSGENQIWQFVEPSAMAGTIGITPDNAVHGPDGLSVALTTDAQSIVAKYDKAFAIGDTIEVSGYKYSSSQAGTFQVLLSLDGSSFTTLPAVAFTNTAPYFQKIKIAVPQSFQYIKVIRSGTGQVNVDAINVFGKGCISSTACGVGSKFVANTNVYPVDASATQVLSGNIDNILGVADGNVVKMYDKIWLDFGQTLTAGGRLSFVAFATGSGYAGNFSVAFSTDGINFSTARSITIPATVTSAQIYNVTVPQDFRYIQIVNPLIGNFNYAIFDAVKYQGGACIQCNVVATAGVTPATCTTGASGGVNANGTIMLTTFGGGATKVGYSIGSSYTGSAFASAATLTTAPFTVVNTLPNPTTDQPYTVRVFATANCYQDYVVTLNPKLCLTADLSVSASPPTAGGNKGEQVTYTFTLTNKGPDAAPNVTACLAIPGNTTFLSATTSQGTYNAGTTIWDLGTVPVGSQTITVTLQMK